MTTLTPFRYFFEVLEIDSIRLHSLASTWIESGYISKVDGVNTNSHRLSKSLFLAVNRQRKSSKVLALIIALFNTALIIIVVVAGVSAGVHLFIYHIVAKVTFQMKDAVLTNTLEL